MELLAGSVMVLGWLNLSNDGYDAETGVDANKSESVVNLTKNKEGVLALAWALLAAGVGVLVHALSSTSNGTICLALLAAAISCGWAYQCPPLRLSYRGLGEALCFASFGPLATTAFGLALSNGGALPAGACVAASVLVGWTTTAILFCSHFHQRSGDVASGKRSPVVRFGKRGMNRILRRAVVGFYAAVLGFFACGLLSVEHLLAYPLSVIPAVRLIRFVDGRVDGEDGELKMAKFRAIDWHYGRRRRWYSVSRTRSSEDHVDHRHYVPPSRVVPGRACEATGCGGSMIEQLNNSTTDNLCVIRVFFSSFC